MKRSLRKRKAGERKETFKTGGGPVANIPKGDNPVMDELCDVISLSVFGLPSRYLFFWCLSHLNNFPNRNDDDAISNPEQAETETEETNIFHDVEYLNSADEADCGDISIVNEDTTYPERPKSQLSQDWTQYNPSMLRSRKTPLLSNKGGRKPTKGLKGQKNYLYVLKKKAIEESLDHARIEHELRKKILEMELKIKEAEYAKLINNNE